MLMNLIGFFIENLSYNWSIITYINSNKNSIGVFHCIKLNLSTERSRDEERAKMLREISIITHPAFYR